MARSVLRASFVLAVGLLASASAACTDGIESDGPDGSGGGDVADATGGAPSEGSGGDSATGTGAGNPTGGGAGGTGGWGEPGTMPTLPACEHVGQGTDYPVGPGQTYESLGAVPFENLQAGDTVRIHARPQPYKEKLMIAGMGTAEQPIRVCGVPGPNGELPVIDGEGAVTRPQLVFPFDGHQRRGVIVVGHPNNWPWEQQPSHIVIEGLEVTGGSPELSFVDRQGNTQSYLSSVAGIFVQRAEDVTIRGCKVHGNNNGMFIGTAGGVELTKRVLIEGNHVYGNGGLHDYYEHNIYNEVAGVIYQFNHFGPPRSGPQGILGSNIKERSSGVIIRYNWIEDGGHLIDLVDTQEAIGDSLGNPEFNESFLYGNVLVRNGASEGSMVHYGGDSGNYQYYRKGTLHFFHNTVVVRNENAVDYNVPALFELSTNEERLESRNNIYYASVTPTVLRPVVFLGVRDGVISGVANFSHDWVSTGWTPYNSIPGKWETVVAEVSGLEGSLGGTNPGFVDVSTGDLRLTSASPAIAAGADLAGQVPDDLVVNLQYVRHQDAAPRTPSATPTIGAMTP